MAVVAALVYLSRPIAPANRPIGWGVTFDEDFAGKLGLNWAEAYLAILDDLKIRHVRLSAYWSEIEKSEGIFDFNDLDWQVQQASQRQAKIILAIGRKLPRWPECYEPSWLAGQTELEKKQQLLVYLSAVIDHYKNNPAITTWQVENEPFLPFGECPPRDIALLDQEIALVKKLDSRPVIVTDSGEMSFWVRAASRADIFGTTLYRKVWNDWLGYVKYPIPPAVFRLKERLVHFLVGPSKPFVVIELQGEPWTHKQIYEITLQQQFDLMSFQDFNDIIDYAIKAGFNEYYWWGVEWWYYLKQQGHPEYWDRVKGLVNDQ